MAKTTTKAKKDTPTPTPPATAPDKRTLKPHKLVLSPTIQSAVAIEAWSKFAGTVDLADLVDDLRERAKKVHGGDMNPGVGEHLRNQSADPLDEWAATVMRNMKRMATDEAYRLLIAKDLS